MSLPPTCKHCDCDNYREELMGNAMMVSSEGNCKNCQHAVNLHPRRAPAAGISSASVINAAVVTEGELVKGQFMSAAGSEAIIPAGERPQPLQQSRPHNVSQQEAPKHPLRSIPLDHSGAHIAQYNPTAGGYVTGTGTVTNNECTRGNYNHNGLTGPGVNDTPLSTGSVAYGGAYNSQYEGGYYSAKRVPNVPSSSPPIAQTVEVKVVSSSPSSSGDGGFDYDAVRAQYGNGYSAKRI